MARILLTGGAGFIGSHTAVALLARGHEVALLDNFSNASRSVPPRLKEITRVDCPVHEVDIRDTEAVRQIFAAAAFEAVIHFAALKAVGESEANPLLYFDVNVAGTLSLLTAMRHAGIGRIVFSSSATVYGAPEHCPIAEIAPLHATNIYGRTKLIMEDMIGDLVRTGILSTAFLLRYFNPVGAHPSGLIGEAPCGVPTNLMPYLCQVAARQRDCLTIFGNDYPTPDGTGIRDYLHVMDLAEAHCAAVEVALGTHGTHAVNLGTGTGHSVMELLHAFENTTGIEIPYKIGARRPGDAPSCYADPALAKTMLGWTAKRTLVDMCRDSWRWQFLSAKVK
ncbi:UDP-glucose 4-epimerase GalE [Gluconacetobacter sp. Hr-1-5]|uniref:UDP-glucose 4-epimerase GalE n=1 Tax=Gluconacetobacter sp. Hr-1-5 TaxID=3395370 RepID=UPI003B51E4CC